MFTDITTYLLSPKAPLQLWIILNQQFLIALHKDVSVPWKIRPIEIGTAWRRFICRHVAKVYAQIFAKQLLPHQFAIGTSGGLELMTQLLQSAVVTMDNEDPESDPMEQFSSAGTTRLCQHVQQRFTS